jgi:hypothetical protein
MRITKNPVGLFIVVLAFIAPLFVTANGQTKNKYEVLEEAAMSRIVPTSFYFAGQSAETQMRNAAAARIGKDRHIMAGLVDTSGYSTEISGKYEGFLITDSQIAIGNRTLGTGAYGFGFSANGRINIFDLSSKQILSAVTKNDIDMKRPRPLMMVSEANGIRLYKGKNYVVISPR